MSTETCDDCGSRVRFISPTGSAEMSLFRCIDCGSEKRLPTGAGETREELIEEICRIVDVDPGESNTFPKWAINASIAYLTGEWRCIPGLLNNRGAPRKADLMRELARECGISGYEHTGAYTWVELCEILNTLKNSADRRD